MTSLKFESVSKSYVRTDGTLHQVVQDFSAEVAASTIVTLIGPNGAGKTTLLNLAAGLLKPDSGSIVLPSSPTIGRQTVGYVWQDYRSSLLPWLSAAENVAFPLKIVGVPKRERQKAAQDAIREFMPTVDPTIPCYALSGGQQQMLCLLRSAVSQPCIMLLDEPLSALDVTNSWHLAGHLERLWLGRKIPIMVVSHDIDEGILLADWIYLVSRDGVLADKVFVPLNRPRRTDMLSATEFTKVRQTIIEFLLAQASSF